MPFQRLLSFKRTLCFSLARKHYRLFKVVIPASFVAICLLLFLRIQHFMEELGHNSRQKTGSKSWSDRIYKQNNNIVVNPELLDRAIFMQLEHVSNLSLKSVKNNYSSVQNVLMNSKTTVQQIIRNQDNSPLHDYGQQVVRSATGTVSETIAKQRSEFKIKPRPIFAVIIVVSRPNNVLLRLAARKTWAEDAEVYRILVRFVVGRQEDWSDIVDRESLMHKDVIIFEDDDTIEVLPSKVIQGFEYALRLRPTPLYIMKIDDDTIVNLPYLAKQLMKPTFRPSQILGAIRTKAEVIRDPENKWSVSILDYPSTVYPPYAFGGGYVMRAQTAKILLEKRYYTNSWIHLEDVYLTGLVAAQAGISHKSHPGFSTWESEKATACDFVQEKRINSVNNTEREFYELYKGIQILLRSGTANHCD